MARSLLLDLGMNRVWWCPACGIVLKKPPRIEDGERWHSWRCQRPMGAVDVHVQPARIDGDADG